MKTQKPMKRLMMSLLLLAMVLVAQANDGVYYVSGNHLVPVQESDIAVTKEILTIDIGDDGYARVDVYYEFTNRGAEKTIDMGFEASLPYNSGDNYNPKGVHPYIKDFTATLNGQKMVCSNGVVKASSDGQPTNFRKLDVKKWHVSNQEEWEDGNTTLTNANGTKVNIAYAYFFRATFKKGLNTVHHTYRYMMSNGVYRAFEIPYWLMPAMRWANHQIDDFTLRIKATGTAKHFYLDDKNFASSMFKVAKGKGKVRRQSNSSIGSYYEVTLRDGMVEWHTKAFKPKRDICISSADQLIMMEDSRDLGSFYDRAGFLPQLKVNYRAAYGREAKGLKEEREFASRLLRNLPYASRGYVFKDANLKKYFASQWWYMPDPDWKMSTDSFTKTDWDVINVWSKNALTGEW